jgi:hypothetical protein
LDNCNIAPELTQGRNWHGKHLWPEPHQLLVRGRRLLAWHQRCHRPPGPGSRCDTYATRPPSGAACRDIIKHSTPVYGACGVNSVL